MCMTQSSAWSFATLLRAITNVWLKRSVTATHTTSYYTTPVLDQRKVMEDFWWVPDDAVGDLSHAKSNVTIVYSCWTLRTTSIDVSRHYCTVTLSVAGLNTGFVYPTVLTVIGVSQATFDNHPFQLRTVQLSLNKPLHTNHAISWIIHSFFVWNVCKYD